jgi:hypothetical protein
MNRADCGLRPSGATRLEPGKHLEDRGDAADAGVQAGGVDACRERRAQPIAEALQLGVPLGGHVPKGRQPGRRRDRVAVERAAVDQRAGPTRVELGHDVRAAAERPGRIAAADDLAERRQVRPYAPEPALGAVRPDPEMR